MITLNILNKTKYEDDQILSTVAYLIEHMEDRIWSEIVEKQLTRVIAYNTKDYIGVNFVI